jgi:hypothetical protein
MSASYEAHVHIRPTLHRCQSPLVEWKWNRETVTHKDGRFTRHQALAWDTVVGA